MKKVLMLGVLFLLATCLAWSQNGYYPYQNLLGFGLNDSFYFIENRLASMGFFRTDVDRAEPDHIVYHYQPDEDFHLYPFGRIERILLCYNRHNQMKAIYFTCDMSFITVEGLGAYFTSFSPVKILINDGTFYEKMIAYIYYINVDVSIGYFDSYNLFIIGFTKKKQSD